MYRKVLKNSQVSLGSPREICEYEIRDIVSPKVCEPLNNIAEEDKCFEASPDEIITKAKKDADLLINEAKEKSRKIVEDAKREAARKGADIEIKAKKDGYEQGLKKAKEEYEEKLRHADNIIKKAKDDHDKIIAGIEGEVLDLALCVAHSIICKEAEVNREYIVDVFRHALEKCCNRDNVILKASTVDYEIIEKSRETLLSSIEGLGNVEIVEDPSLSAGDCIIETPFGSVNASIDKKFKKLKCEFEKLLTETISK